MDTNIQVGDTVIIKPLADHWSTGQVGTVVEVDRPDSDYSVVVDIENSGHVGFFPEELEVIKSNSLTTEVDETFEEMKEYDFPHEEIDVGMTVMVPYFEKGRHVLVTGKITNVEVISFGDDGDSVYVWVELPDGISYDFSMKEVFKLVYGTPEITYDGYATKPISNKVHTDVIVAFCVQEDDALKAVKDVVETLPTNKELETNQVKNEGVESWTILEPKEGVEWQTSTSANEVHVEMYDIVKLLDKHNKYYGQHGTVTHAPIAGKVGVTMNDYKLEWVDVDNVEVIVSKKQADTLHDADLMKTLGVPKGGMSHSGERLSLSNREGAEDLGGCSYPCVCHGQFDAVNSKCVCCVPVPRKSDSGPGVYRDGKKVADFVPEPRSFDWSEPTTDHPLEKQWAEKGYPPVLTEEEVDAMWPGLYPLEPETPSISRPRRQVSKISTHISHTLSYVTNKLRNLTHRAPITLSEVFWYLAILSLMLIPLGLLMILWTTATVGFKVVITGLLAGPIFLVAGLLIADLEE